MKLVMRSVINSIQEIAGKNKNNSQVLSIVDLTRRLVSGFK
jgi:hypothetical protein